MSCTLGYKEAAMAVGIATITLMTIVIIVRSFIDSGKTKDEEVKDNE